MFLPQAPQIRDPGPQGSWGGWGPEQRAGGPSAFENLLGLLGATELEQPRYAVEQCDYWDDAVKWLGYRPELWRYRGPCQ